MTQSDLLAKAPHSGHPEVVGIYYAAIRFSLEPNHHFFDHISRNSLSLNVAV